MKKFIVIMLLSVQLLIPTLNASESFDKQDMLRTEEKSQMVPHEAEDDSDVAYILMFVFMAVIIALGSKFATQYALSIKDNRKNDNSIN